MPCIFVAKQNRMMGKIFLILLTVVSFEGIAINQALAWPAYKNITKQDSTTKRTVGILIFENAEVLDFAGPFEVFSVSSQIHNNELFDVRMIAKTKDPVHAVNGLSVNPDHSFADAPKLDILIISGGMGAGLLLKDEETLRWIEKTVEGSELTMSVCTGASLLAKLGYLDGKPYCTHHTVYPFVEKIAPTAKPQKEERFIQ